MPRVKPLNAYSLLTRVKSLGNRDEATIHGTEEEQSPQQAR